MAVSSDDNAARVTLDSIRLIRDTLGVHTCLGVSNVSFALPERQDSLARGIGKRLGVISPEGFQGLFRGRQVRLADIEMVYLHAAALDGVGIGRQLADRREGQLQPLDGNLWHKNDK